MENMMKNVDTKIDNIEGKIGHIDLIDGKLNKLIQLLQQPSASESQPFDSKPTNNPLDVAFVSSMQQPLDTLVNLCSAEKMWDNYHGTESDPIIISTQEKDCRLVYNLRKRKDRKASTYLRTPYTNPLKKPRETTDVEVDAGQEIVDFEVRPLIPQEELLELERWMAVANEKNEP